MAVAAITALLERPVLQCTGRDTLPLLQRISTAALEDLPDDGARRTVFCTPKGRLVDCATVLRRGPLVWLAGSPGGGDALADHLERYIISDDVAVEPAAGAATLLVAGDDGLRLLAAVTGLAVRPDHVTADGERLAWVEPGGLGWLHGPADGVRARAGELAAQGATALAAEQYDAWRIAAGIPAFGREIAADWNPLEAGLGPAIAFQKGCYIGQEVVARLHYYEKQKRQLVRLGLDGDPGSLPAALDGGAGTITSAAATAGDRWAALAYLRVEAAGPGAPVRCGPVSGTVTMRVGGDPDAPPPTGPTP